MRVINQKKKTMLALGIGMPVVIAAVIYAWPQTIIYSGSQLLPPNIDRNVGASEKIIIGTVQDVEVRTVKSYLYGDPSLGEPEVEETESLYQFVTVEVERYLKDETGAFPTQVTFRDYVNGCFDIFEKKCAYNEHAIEYKVGEKILVVGVQNLEGELAVLGYVSTYKMTDDGRFQNKYSEELADEPKSLATIEEEINKAIDRRKGN